MNSYSELALETDAAIEPERDNPRNVSLCEVLDRVLTKGVVVAGEIVISVADIDLVYLNLQALLCSVDTACRAHRTPAGSPMVSKENR
jgi:hypothetical protein